MPGARLPLPVTSAPPHHDGRRGAGRSKWMVEEILRDFARSPAGQQWSIAILRYFNPVGAHPSGRIGEDPSGVPNNLMPFVSQVAVGRRPHLNVYGTLRSGLIAEVELYRSRLSGEQRVRLMT